MSPSAQQSTETKVAEGATAKVSPLPPGRKVRKRRSPWPTRIVVLLVLAGGGFWLARAAKKKPIVVELAQVERGPVRDEISSSTAGQVLPERDATVRAELSGRALAVRHQRGERVKAGEVIVALDPADLAARLRQAQATVDAQRASVAQSEAHVEAALRVAERLKRLSEHGAETTSAADDASATAREAQAAAKAARAQLEQSEAAVQVARVARAHAELTAPFDGIISDLPVTVGDELQLGAPVFELVDDSRLRVEATLDEADIGKVKVGQAANLRLDALPNHPIAGAVSKLDPTVRKDEKGVRTLRIEVEVTDLPQAVAAGLRAGMSANVDVRVAEKDNVLSLPTNVIIGRGTKRSVYRVEQGVVHEQPIEIGMSSWDRTELVRGLSDGDQVVSTLNAKGLTEGALVTSAGGKTP